MLSFIKDYCGVLLEMPRNRAVFGQFRKDVSAVIVGKELWPCFKESKSIYIETIPSS